MTLDEYKAQYPQAEVLICSHDAATNTTTTRTMTDEEYQEWCESCVQWINENPMNSGTPEQGTE